MKRFLKPVSVLLALVMIFSVSAVAPIRSAAAETEDVQLKAENNAKETKDGSEDTVFGELTDGGYVLENKTYVLSDDFKAEGYIYVPENVNAVIDLCGSAIYREPDEKSENGYIILNNGTLKIEDSSEDKSGVLSGGYAENGGAVNNTGSLTVENVTFSENKAVNGGAVWSSGTLSVSGCIFKNNVMTGDGAVWSSGTADISDSEISGNTGAVNGGAAVNFGTMTIRNSKLSGNTVSSCGGAVYTGNNGNNEIEAELTLDNTSVENNSASRGGGIYIQTDTAIVKNGSKFLENKATDHGGAVYIEGRLVFEDGTVEKNTAENYGGAVYDAGDAVISGGSFNNNRADEAGAVYVMSGKTLTVTAGQFTGNRATVFAGGAFSNHGSMSLLGGMVNKNVALIYGGGIYNAEQADLYFTGGTVTENTSMSSGGGILNLDSANIYMSGSPKVIDNKGSNLFLDGESVINVNGEFTDEADIDITAKNTPRALTSGFESNGNTDTGVFSFNKDSDLIRAYISEGELWTITVADKWVSNWEELNRALTDKMMSGKTVALKNDIKAENGEQSITISDTDVTLELDGHTVDINRSSADYEDYGNIFRVVDDSVFTVKDSIGGGKITGGKAINGGAFAVDEGCVLNLENVSVSENSSRDAGGGIYCCGTLVMSGGSIDNNTSAHGGAVYFNLSGTGEFKESVSIKDNSADDAGGIRVSNSSSLSISDAVISGNEATTGAGGGIFNEGSLTLTRCSLLKNSTAKSGGGLYNSSTVKTEISYTRFKSNTASQEGGGIYGEKGEISVTGGSIEENSGTHGGGVKLNSTASFNAGDTIFDSNSASVRGGALYSDAAVVLSACEITDNTADGEGGGIFPYAGSVTLIGGKITGNSAVNNGGGIYAYEGAELKMQGNPVIKENQATDVFLPNGKKITISGTLKSDADIYIDMYSKTGVFTNDYSKYNSGAAPSKYFSVKGEYSAVLDDSGEARINGSDWGNLQALIDSTADNSSLVLMKDYKAVSEDKRLVIPAGKRITINLNGHVIDRNRLSLDTSSEGETIQVLGTLTLKDVSSGGTVTGGNSDKGGCISVAENGSLILKSGILRGSKATSGGGVFVAQGGTFTMKGGSIKNNSASDGAGIYTDGESTIMGGDISSNSSGSTGGGIYISSSGSVKIKDGSVFSNTSREGAGIYNVGQFTMINGKVYSNSASVDGGAVMSLGTTDVFGGDIYSNSAVNSGGAVFAKNGTFTFSGGSMTSNYAEKLYGGAVYSVCTFNLFGGKITDNEAGTKGGAVRIAGGTFNVKNDPYVRGNISPQGRNILLDSGMTVSLAEKLSDDAVIDVSVSDTSKPVTSGFTQSGTSMSVFSLNENENSSFEVGSDNELYVKIDANAYAGSWKELQNMLNNSSYNGKTIALRCDIYANGENYLSLKNGRNITIDLNGHKLDRQLTDDESDKDGHVFWLQGGSVLNIKDTSGTGIITGGYADNGGALNISSDCTVNMEGGTITGNKCGDHGGGVYVYGTFNMTGGAVTLNSTDSNCEGGGIYSQGKVNLKNAVISRNTSNFCGGIRLTAASVLTAENTRIINNTSTGSIGGGIINDGKLEMTGCVVSGNRASKSGGGLYNNSGSVNTIVKFTSCKFDNNRSDNSCGGAINIDSGTVVMRSGSVSGNSAQYGAGVRLESDSTFSADGTEFNGNSAKSNGGSVYSDGTLTLKNCSVTGSSAADGGAIYIASGTTDVFDSSLTGNRTSSGGGAVFISGGSFNAQDTEFKKNSSNTGGAVFNSSSAVLNGCTLTYNSSHQNGGAVYTNKNSLVLAGTSVTGNTSGANGGGIYASSDVYVEGLVTVSDNTASKGTGIYLCDKAMVNASDELHRDCVICITMEKNTGECIRGAEYYEYMKPGDYFTADAGYVVIPYNETGAQIVASDWSSLQEEIDKDLSYIKLSRNWTADSGNDHLIIREGMSLVIDLNGYTLDRNRLALSSDTDGEVFLVLGDLTVTDSTGKGCITGGNGKLGGGITVAEGGSFTFEGGNITGNRAENGGGIFTESETSFVMTGGCIKDNCASVDGGGIFTRSDTDISGGEIISNTAENSGGAIFAENSSTVSVSDCLIKGNSVNELFGGAIYTDGKLELSGGTVTENTSDNKGGGIYINENGSISVKDAPYVKGNNALSGKNIYLLSGKKISLSGKLSAEACIDITMCDTSKEFTQGFSQSASDKSAFSANEDPDVMIKENSEGELYIDVSADVWANSWKNLQSLINNDSYKGKVIGLSCDIYAKGEDVLLLRNSRNVIIDLNGHILDRQLSSKKSDKDGHVFWVTDNSVLTVRDSAGTGIITGGYANRGGAVNISGNCIFNMESGTIIGNRSDKYAGAVMVYGEFNMTGGAITGNRTDDSCEGGAIYSQGKVSIKDSVISENTSNFGGAIRLTSGSDFYAENTRFLNNRATSSIGGCIINDGTLTLKNCSFSGNTASKNGGDIYNNNGSKKTVITGTTFSNSSSSNNEGGALMLVSGTVEITDCDIVSASALRGGAMKINSGVTLSAQNVRMDSCSASDRGGAVYTDGNVTLTDCSVKGCSAENGGGIYVYKGSAILSGSGLSECTASSEGGGVYVNTGSLSMNGGFINSCSASNGGGIKINSDVTFSSESSSFTGNKAEKCGGAVYSDGTIELNKSDISANRSVKEGAGIYVYAGSLTLDGGVITDNSGTLGSGVYTKQNIDICNDVIIQDNSGSNLYLEKDRKIIIGNDISSSQIGVCLYSGSGVFTDRYSEFCGDDPYIYFTSDEGHEMYIDSGEVSIKEYVEEADSFIDANSQITDYTHVNGTNWMAAVSGERTLNEINTPGTHDSAMANVAWNVPSRFFISVVKKVNNFFGKLGVAGYIIEAFVVAQGFFIGLAPLAITALGAGGAYLANVGNKYAQTQYRYIDEQLDDGVRNLDLRLNNLKPVLRTGFTDDGKNLWLCHGKDETAGAYYGLNHNGDYIKLTEVFDQCEEFLRKHPTETLVLDFEAETIDKEKYEALIFSRLKSTLETYSYHVNPSTRKPYIYWEDEIRFKPFTYYPKLKDVRGQILIKCTDTKNIGGMTWTMGGNYVAYSTDCEMVATPEERVQDIMRQFDTYGLRDLPTDASAHTDYSYRVKVNTTSSDYFIFSDDYKSPVELEDEVFELVLDDGKFFDQHGKYVGTVKMDAITAKQARYVWESNFFEGLDYVTVTVKSQLDPEIYPDRTYKLLRGTEITIPDCIYDSPQQGYGYFQNWKAESSDSEGEIYYPDDTVTVDKDMTFTAQWGPEIRTPLQINWVDGDNADSIRAKKLTFNVTYRDQTAPAAVTVDETDNWKTVLTGDIKSVVPVWDRIDTSSDEKGVDCEGQYRFETDGRQGAGIDITLYHSPVGTVGTATTVSWDDENDRFKQRPDQLKVNLYKNGELYDFEILTSEDGWQCDFNPQNEYENYQKVSYTVSAGDVDGYSFVSDGFDITGVFDYSGLVVVNGGTQWEDSFNAYGDRPETFTVHLFADGEEIASQEIESGDSDYTLWSFDIEDYVLSHAGEDILYSITLDEIPGYITEIEKEGHNFKVVCKLNTDDKYFKGHSLTLNGDIDINFFVKMTDEEAEDAYIDFKWFDNEIKGVVPEKSGNSEFYKVSCPVAAAEMTYDVSATLYIHGKAVETNSYSVAKYAGYILTSEEFEKKYIEEQMHTSQEYDQLISLVKAMLDFGTKAQIRFDRNTDIPANFGSDYFTNDVTSDMIRTEADIMAEGLDEYGLEYQYSSVVFLSGMSLRHYYRITDSDLFDSATDVLINGKAVQYTVRGDFIFFEISDIPAAKLDDQYEITIGDNTYKYCVMDYIKLLLDSSLSDESKDLGKATYRYNQYANAYFKD